MGEQAGVIGGERGHRHAAQVEFFADAVHLLFRRADGDRVERKAEAVGKVEVDRALVARARHKVEVKVARLLFLRARGLVRRKGGEVDLVCPFVHLYEPVPGVAAVVAELVVDQHADDGVAVVVGQVDEAGAVVVPRGDHKHVVVRLRYAPDALALLVQVTFVRAGRAAGEDVVRGDDGGILGEGRQHAVEPRELGVVGFVHHLDEQIAVAARVDEGIAARAARLFAVRSFEVQAVAVCVHRVRIGRIFPEIRLIIVEVAPAEVVVAGNKGDGDARLREWEKGAFGALPLLGAVPVFDEVAHVHQPLQVDLAAVVDQPLRGRVRYLGRKFDGVLRVGDEGECVVVFIAQRVGVVVAEGADVRLRVEQPLRGLERAFADADLLDVAAQQLGQEVVFLRVCPLVEVVGDDRADAEVASVFGGVHAVHPAARVIAERFARVGKGLERVAVAVAGDGDVVPRAAVVHRKPPKRAVELRVRPVLGHVLDLFAVRDVDLHGAVVPLVVPPAAAQLRAAALACEDVHPRVRGVVVFRHHEDDLDGVPVHERLAVDGGVFCRAQVGVFHVVEDESLPFRARKGVHLLLIFLRQPHKLHAARISRHGDIFKREEVCGARAVVRYDQLEVVAVAALVAQDEVVVLQRSLRRALFELPVGIDAYVLFRRVCARDLPRDGGRRGEHESRREHAGGRAALLQSVHCFCSPFFDSLQTLYHAHVIKFCRGCLQVVKNCNKFTPARRKYFKRIKAL